VGYVLFKHCEGEEIATKECSATFNEFSRFSKIMVWESFQPFSSQEQALSEMQSIASSTCTELTTTWLKSSLPKVKEGKKCKYKIGTCDPLFGASVNEKVGVPCRVDDYVKTLYRYLRKHVGHFLEKNTAFEAADLLKASVGLGHEYSRSKVAFDVKAQDNHIVHAISLLEDLNKTLNGQIQRVKEWYGWHFPELEKVIDDQVVFCKTIKVLGNRLDLTEEKQEELKEIFEDELKIKEIVSLAKVSMGTAFSEIDLEMLNRLNERCLDMAESRDLLQKYLESKMSGLAPNLTEIVGSTVGAKLIAHTGSLVKLAKCPASTIQVLGAEKALFRALKARSGKTPKYGLIFNSSWISRAKDKDRGRMSRVLSNKLAMASRIDCFSKEGAVSNIYGKKLREQLEERLDYWATGKVPRTNEEVMKEANDELEIEQKFSGKDSEEVKAEATSAEAPKKKKKKKKKKKSSAAEAAPVVPAPAPAADSSATKKKKKKKKKKRSASEAQLDTPQPEKKQKTEAKSDSKKKKKKKKKKSKSS